MEIHNVCDFIRHLMNVWDLKSPFLICFLSYKYFFHWNIFQIRSDVLFFVFSMWFVCCCFLGFFKFVSESYILSFHYANLVLSFFAFVKAHLSIISTGPNQLWYSRKTAESKRTAYRSKCSSYSFANLTWLYNVCIDTSGLTYYRVHIIPMLRKFYIA